MMFGMFGLGWLMMLLVIGLPLLLVMVLVGGAAGILQDRSHVQPDGRYQPSINSSLVHPAPAPGSYPRYCSHCGTGLHADWTHCPQCGAPASS